MKAIAHTTLAALLTALLAGCQSTRSISNSNARDADMRLTYPPRRSTDFGFEYRGEISEFDVLAVNRGQAVSEEEITRALDTAKPIRLRPGSAILLVQSGAMFPDAPMVEGLSTRCEVIPFSGVPPKRKAESDPAFSYAKSLRLAAARAGAETIVCYWGILESGRRNLETKTISWVPLAGWMIPDESQSMRIRLKLALIDVRSGNWRMISPDAFEKFSASTMFTRGSSDRKQVESLKKRAYEAATRELFAGLPE